MQRRHTWFVLYLPIMAACGGGDSSTPPAVGPTEPTRASIQSTIFDVSCALSGCHAGPAPAEGMDLSVGQSFGGIIGVRSNQDNSLSRVEPGQPENSYLALKLEGRGFQAQMPRGRPPLPQERIDAVRQWIMDGAP